MPGVPQGSVISLEVCLSWHREGCVLRMVASLLRADALCRRRWDRVGVTHAGLHEGIERVFIAVVSAWRCFPAGRAGACRVWFFRVSDFARVSGGSRGGASPGALASS